MVIERQHNGFWLHDVPCPLCGANHYTTRFPATRKASAPDASHFCCTNSHLGQHGDIVECVECGMAYNNPQIDAAALTTLYRNVEDPRYLEEQAGRRLTFQRSLAQLQRFRRPPGRLLDVGCYTGAFLRGAADAGWEVCGFELSAWAVGMAKAAGFPNVYGGELRQMPLEPASLDAATLWDVIEHLPAPAETLDDVARFLKPGGLLAISTHLIDSLPARLMGRRYPFFMEMHVVHFSRRTMRRMLAEHHFEPLAFLPHYRVIRAAYFLEKLQSLLPFGKRLFSPLLRQSFWQEQTVTISWSGLSNIFARRV